jgi:hypothetical protein
MKGPYIMTDKTSADLFSFDHDGKTYTFEQSFDVVRSPRWLRENRRRDELDLMFTILEEIGGDEVVEVVDSMDADEFLKFSKQINKELSKSFR